MGTQKLDLQNFGLFPNGQWVGKVATNDVAQGLVPLRLNIFWCCFFADAGFIGKALQHNVELNPKYFLWNSCNFGRTKMCSHYDQRDKWNGKLVNSTRRWMKYQEMQQHWRIVELFRSWPPGGWSRCCCSGGLAHSRFLSFHFSGVKKSGGKKSPEESIVWVNPTHIANDKPWDWKPTEAAKNQKVKLSTTIWL